MSALSPPLPRLWKFVEQPANGSACWLWTGATERRGYGRAWAGNGKVDQAHRIFYQALRSPIPPGLDADHLCRNRRCVNPWHIEPVPRGVNVLRGEGPVQNRSRATHCLWGHPLKGYNLYVWRGHRMCRECRNRVQREHYQRSKEKKKLCHP